MGHSVPPSLTRSFGTQVRVKLAAHAVSKLCIRLMLITFMFMGGSVWFAVSVGDLAEYEKFRNAGDVNMSHFSFFIGLGGLPWAIVETQRYLKFVLKNAAKIKKTRRVTPRKSVSGSPFGSLRAMSSNMGQRDEGSCYRDEQVVKF